MGKFFVFNAALNNRLYSLVMIGVIGKFDLTLLLPARRRAHVHGGAGESGRATRPAGRRWSRWSSGLALMATLAPWDPAAGTRDEEPDRRRLREVAARSEAKNEPEALMWRDQPLTSRTKGARTSVSASLISRGPPLCLFSLLLPLGTRFYVLGALAAYWLLAARRPTVFLTQISPNRHGSSVRGPLHLRLLRRPPALDPSRRERTCKGFGATLAALVRFGPMTFYGGALDRRFAGEALVYIDGGCPFATGD